MRVVEPYQWLMALGLLVGLPLVAWLLDKRQYPIVLVMPLSVGLILGTSALAGWFIGFEIPINDGDQLYYYDAIKIENPLTFIRGYVEAQPTTLLKHTRTNPPGATLNIYVLNQIVGQPALISITNVILCGSLTAFFMWGVMRRIFADDVPLAGYVALLLMVLPSIQIYYTNGTDPIITTSLFGVIYFLLHENERISIVGGVASLFMASWTTFLFVFILPILVCYVVFYRDAWRRVVGMFAGLIMLYLLIWLGLGYNYIESFQTASYIENYIEQSAGLNTYSNTTNYIMTRIEGVAEIILFFTPFMFIRMVQGVPIALRERSRLLLLSALALCSYGGMALLGIWRTGETARLAMFMYPYLVFPVAYTMYKLQTKRWQRVALLTAVFAQTILMQVIGIYFA